MQGVVTDLKDAIEYPSVDAVSFKSLISPTLIKGRAVAGIVVSTVMLSNTKCLLSCYESKNKISQLMKRSSSDNPIVSFVLY